jgi:hypothetical protein
MYTSTYDGLARIPLIVLFSIVPIFVPTSF